MIFQFFNLLDDLTVVDNVLLPAQLGGMRAAEGRARADELLEMMRARPRTGTPIRRGSPAGSASGSQSLARS